MEEKECKIHKWKRDWYSDDKENGILKSKAYYCRECGKRKQVRIE